MSIVPDRELVSENVHEKIKFTENKDHSWSYFRNLLPADIKYIVHESLDYESLKSLCGVDKSWSKICGTDLGKKIMEKKFKEMVHKEFYSCLRVVNLLQKINGSEPIIIDKPGVEYVGINKAGKVTTDIAIMWYLYPKYCVHVIKNGFTEDWKRGQHKITTVEDVIAVHKASPLNRWGGDGNTICQSAIFPFLRLSSFSDQVKTMVNKVAYSNSNHKKIPSEDMKNLEYDPMDPSAWKRPSIRKAIKEYFPQVSFEEIMDAIFPGELDQARAKHSIRFR